MQWVGIGLSQAVRSYRAKTRSAGPTEGYQLHYQFEIGGLSQALRNYRYSIAPRALNGSRMYKTCSRPRRQSSDKQTVIHTLKLHVGDRKPRIEEDREWQTANLKGCLLANPKHKRNRGWQHLKPPTKMASGKAETTKQAFVGKPLTEALH